MLDRCIVKAAELHTTVNTVKPKLYTTATSYLLANVWIQHGQPILIYLQNC